MVENLLKVIHVLEGLQQAEHLRMLNVYRLQSTKIGNWQCKNQKLIWGFQKLPCPRCWLRILAWNVSWQNWLCGFCYQSRRNIMLQLLLMLGELCEVSKCLPWRGLRRHCPMYNVSCILYLLQRLSLFFILHGWIPSGLTAYYNMSFSYLSARNLL